METPRRRSDNQAHRADRKKKREDRGFAEIPLHPVGEHKRPGSSRRQFLCPPLAAWRINLAVLSQHYDLYVVAASHSLLLYQPDIVDQALPVRPPCQFKLPISKPGLRGQTSDDPHTINNIIVGDLGTEELVLCACDDGDVIGYWTKDLVHFLQECKDRAKKEVISNSMIPENNGFRVSSSGLGNPTAIPAQESPLDRATRITLQTVEAEQQFQEDEVALPRPYFHDNVGASAWGLAIHKEARFIAVSSNSTNIFVFSPALGSCAELSQEEIDRDQHILESRNSYMRMYNTVVHGVIDPRAQTPNTTKLWHLYKNYQTDVSPVGLVHPREASRRSSLSVHRANIPAIGFCNVDEDKRGMYLASTDVDGTTIIWNVHRAIPVRIMEYPVVDDPVQDHAEQGWGALFLDRRSFAPTKSIVEAMGTCSSIGGIVETSGMDAYDFFPRKRRLTLWDITDSQPMVQNSGRWSIGDKRTPQAGADRYLVQGSDTEIHADVANDSADDEEMQNDSLIGLPPSRPAGSGYWRPLGLATYRNNLDGKIPYSESITYQHQLLPMKQEIDTTQVQLHEPRWPLFSIQSLHAGTGLDSDLGSPFVPSPHEMPDSPFMLVNPQAIHLFQSGSLLNPPNGQSPSLRKVSLRHQQRRDSGPPLPPKDATSKVMLGDGDVDPGPTIYIEDPLAQDSVPHVSTAFHLYDRMTMTSQIPELGVVLLGSGKGRVAVFTLHHLIPDPTKRMNSIEEPTYTMRLDHILPFHDQEEQCLRPLDALVGVSSSPVFGENGRKVHDRWRIFLLYRDHTVLAYEIWRPGTGPFDQLKAHYAG